MACTTVASVVIVVGLPVANASAAPVSIPPNVPATSHPSPKSCSSVQKAFLREAFRLAHYYTWRADRLIDWIDAKPKAGEAEWWSRDFTSSDADSPSPRAWFGPYSHGRLRFIHDALGKAAARFAGKAKGLKRIKRVRCGAPGGGVTKDTHTDGCPGGNPGADGPPSAYHAPPGTIVTCGPFWNAATTGLVPRETRVDRAARTLVHEVFHYVRVGTKWVWDRRACRDGKKKVKCYGAARARHLASTDPGRAIRNNANYEFFAWSVGRHEPAFSGVWADKEPGGTGGLFFDMSWDQLVANWEALAGAQFLADVETYERAGERRYAALWRVGSGNGALHMAPWAPFTQTWSQLKGTQDLIDLELFRVGGGWRYLGVYRHKPAGTSGDGGLLVGMDWSALNRTREQLAGAAYLADVETYVDDAGRRRYAGVWRAGAGGDALLSTTDSDAFDATKEKLDPSMQLIDYEVFRRTDGRLGRLGVWRPVAGRGRGLHRGLTMADLIARWQAARDTRTLIDLEEVSALPAQVP